MSQSEVLMAQLCTMLNRPEDDVTAWVEHDLRPLFKDYVDDFANQNPSNAVPDSAAATQICDRHLSSDNFQDSIYADDAAENRAGWTHLEHVARFMGRAMTKSFGSNNGLVRSTDDRAWVFRVLYKAFMHLRAEWDEERQEAYDMAPTNGH
jgi:hypothetical protein